MSAFDHPLVTAAGLELQAPAPTRANILAELHRPDLGLLSPLWALYQPGSKLEFGDQSVVRHLCDEEMSELVFLFARPIDECRAALDLGRGQFRAIALRTVEDMLPEMLIEELVFGILEHVEALNRKAPSSLPPH